MKFAHTFTSFKTVFRFCKPWPGTNLLLVLQLRGAGVAFAKIMKESISWNFFYFLSLYSSARIFKDLYESNRKALK